MSNGIPRRYEKAPANFPSIHCSKLILTCHRRRHAKGLANKELQKRIPLGRFGTASEVADAVAFLAKNEYANNCILNLDGGVSAV